MSNDFEFQSKCLTNDNINSENNEEEDTEDMSEDIDKEGDDNMNIERVVNTEDKTKSVPKRDLSRIIKVVKVPTLQQKNNESELSVERAIDSGQTTGRQVFIKVFKCTVKDCTTFCLDETALKKHLETEHKSVIVDNVKNELNKDMSEDIDKEGDELMSADELNREDNNQLTAEPNSGQNKSSVELLAELGDASKSEIVLDTPKKKQLTKSVSVCSGQTAKDSTLSSKVKCIIVGCKTKCKDQRGLEKHLEVVHRLMYIKGPKQTSSAKTRRASPVSSMPSPLDINVEPVFDKSKSSIGKGCHLSKQTKEVILNLKQYFDALFADESVQTVVDAMKKATKISSTSIYKTIKEFKDTGTLKKPVDKTKVIKPLKYKYNDEDRDILSRVIYKLRDENRLRGYMSVYNEIKTSKEFNPTFKKTDPKTFGELFKRFGFRISDNRIIDIKPSESERERMACKRSEESKLVCDLAGMSQTVQKHSAPNNAFADSHQCQAIRVSVPEVCLSVRCFGKFPKTPEVSQ